MTGDEIPPAMIRQRINSKNTGCPSIMCQCIANPFSCFGAFGLARHRLRTRVHRHERLDSSGKTSQWQESRVSFNRMPSSSAVRRDPRLNLFPFR
jgi:hypothetical protein